MLELNVYKNTDSTSAQYGKAYARVDYKEMFDVSKLAKHMSEHNTPFSEGTIRGILTDMVKCIRELTLNGNTVKIENLAIFKASVQSNPCSRYGVMRATIGSKTVRVNGETVETGNAVKSLKLLAQATGEYMRDELNKDAVLGWTKKAQDAINADKAVMNAAANGNG
jgi:nucleoid DNA-binding protein